MHEATSEIPLTHMDVCMYMFVDNMNIRCTQTTRIVIRRQELPRHICHNILTNVMS